MQQLKLGVHTDNPINKNGSNVLVNVPLVFHVKAIWLGARLRLLHVFLDVLAVQAHMINVA